MALANSIAQVGDSKLHVLDEAGATRVWNWILARQGLTDSQRLNTVIEVADAVLGLHAARLPSPYAIVATRASHSDVPASLFTDQARASLMTIRCMRKTLHTLPIPLAAAAHLATVRFRDRDARRALQNAGYAPAAIERLIDRLHALLQDGPLAHRTIERRMSHLAEVLAIRIAIKTAWERGTISYINATTAWNREVRTFALTAVAYPALDLSLSREEAITRLVTAYFDRYGPATLRDATWWSGLAASDIVAALRACGRQVTAVATPWSSDPCLMFADRAAECAANSGIPTGVQLLAHEDTALKAYFQTRKRYLDSIPQERAFNRIGEALPCVIVDGMVAGTWSWNTRTASVNVHLIPGRTSAFIRRAAIARAAALTETLRVAWSVPSRRAVRGHAVLAPAVPPIGIGTVRSTASVTTCASTAPHTR